MEKNNKTKKEIFKLIKLNSEDGTSLKEIEEHFDLGRTMTRNIVTELLIDQKIREFRKSRFKFYKAVKK